MAKQGREHAVGPYTHGLKYRIIYIGANGAREAVSYTTEAEAVKNRDAFNAAAGTRTVGEAVTEYLTAHAPPMWKTRGVETTRHRLVAFLRLKEGDRPLTAINAPTARELYKHRVGEVAVDTHQGELQYARRFMAWCVAQGWIRINPFADIKPEGKKKKGKPKLRVNGTRLFMATLLEDSSLEATAVLTALMLGLRATEVISRTVEDLDDDGRLMWIRDSKTEHSDREIEVPDVLRARLLKLAAGLGAKARLFGDMTRHALHYHTVRYCKVAGVDRVTPHGLRGSGATTAVRLGGSVEQVARALGHGDEGVTLKAHYLGGGAMESARARMIEGMIPATPNVPHDRIVSLAPTPIGVYSSYETRALVTEVENAVTIPDNQETN